MLGKFSKGMLLSVPARFRSGNQPVDVDNVVVAIEYFSKDLNKVMRLLDETYMKKIDTGEYIFEYVIPQTADIGSYIVRIKAKPTGSRSSIVEATDHFEIIDSMQVPVASISTAQPEVGQPEYQNSSAPVIQQLTIANPPRIQGDPGAPKLKPVEDVVLDVYNSPIGGVHVNIFDKRTFIPGAPSNLKVASAFTSSDGKFSVNLLPGEYVFSYKGINLREFREFRKVQ